MRVELDSSELSQLSEADGPLKHSDGLKVPKWARGALTPRTPCDVPACSTQPGYHSSPPRQQHAKHSARALDDFWRIGGGEAKSEWEVRMERGAASAEYVAERLEHLGIVAGVCREIGLEDLLS